MAHPHSKAPPPRSHRAPAPRERRTAVSGAGGTRDALLNRVFNNRFRIQQLIAKGGMGKVYRATQVPLGRTVALKVLHPSFTTEQLESFHQRFFLEAAIAARLSHPNTVTVFDFGKSDDAIFYIAMEYLQGVSLRTALQREHGVSIARTLHIATQIGNALREAHALGAVHRDLKPANVFLVQRGGDSDFVKVLDFGLVKQIALDDSEPITRPGKFLGSPGYMAPEQIRGKPVDARCDIYTLGVLMYEMLAGTPPFVRTGPVETMMAHVHDAVPGLTRSHPARRIPRALAAIVERCLEKEPARRYESMDALLDALAPWAAEASGRPSGRPSVPGSGATVSRVPAALGDAEGWSVVSSTGILARPGAAAGARRAMAHRPPPRAQDAASDAATLAMSRAGDPASAKTLLLDAAAYRPVPARKERAARKPSYVVGAALAAGLLMATAAWHVVATARAAACRVTLRSAPAGARAFMDDTLVCERTPCEVWLEGSAAKRGRWLRVRFVMDGFDEFVSARQLVAPAMEIAATLDTHD